MAYQLNKGKIFSYLVTNQKDLNFFEARNRANYLLQGSRSIWSKEVQDVINFAISHYQFNNQVDSKNYLNLFVEHFTKWINLPGLNDYYADFSNGTTQAFDSFYFRHRNKRFRCYPGEYFYHLKTWQSNNVEWSFITDKNPLTENDAVVLSVPFCDTGNVQYLNIISICEEMNIPVLLDMCYYPLTDLQQIDLTSNAIDTVCFSLSKIFPVANHRIGIRYTKNHLFDGQKLHHSIGYANVLSAHIGKNLMDRYSADYLHKTYKQKQQVICNFLNIEPSQSVIFALGNADWNMYNRSNLLNEYQLSLDPTMFRNRICLVPFFENWDLFERFMNAH